MSNKIKSSDLPKIWAAPDNSRLVPKQTSIRLPVHVAAKIYALEALYPNKTRTQLINDLLSTALEGIGESIPSYKGKFIHEVPLPDNDHEDVGIYEDVGQRSKFYSLFNKYYYELERESGNDGEIVQYHPIVYEDGSLGIEFIYKK